MRTAHHWPLLFFVGLATPTAIVQAQTPWDSRVGSIATTEGYSRGVQAGEDDARRGDAFDYTDESDYRRGDAGYRSQAGNRDRYAIEFRRAFADGYAAGYDRGRTGRNFPGGRDAGRGGWDGRGSGPQDYGRGGGPGGYGRGTYRNDVALLAGVNDGYEAGLDDGRDGRRFDPVGERRYRSADHGYDRRYGSRDAWKVRYREGFTRGYEEGFNDGRQYGGRYDGRYDRRPINRPWWWPF